MKIECLIEKLRDAVSRVEKTINKNSNLPILSSILFTASGKTLTIKATNLEVGVEISIPVKIHSEGIVATPAVTLQQVLFNIKSDKILTISEENGVLVISVESTKTVLKTIPYEEFPIIPRIEKPESVFKLKTKDLCLGIKSVIFSASLSSIKPEQGSVYIYHKDNSLVFVATDSFRLAERKITLKTNNQIPPLLIPYKNCLEILRVLDGVESEIELSVSKNQINITFPDYFIVSRLVDGTFPDYEQIIPKEITTTVTFLKQDLIDILKTLTIFSDKFNQLTFLINKNQNTTTLETKNSDVGEGQGSLKTKVLGESLTINFNQKYIQDVFQSISDESVNFAFGGLHKPLVIEGAANKNFRYLVMPMNR
ncbi:MAG: DNA polymerase III subunit beta [bacterium]|nr:DNA polymerase III subunit beta [bacterium]